MNQLDFQLAIDVIDADVVIRQSGSISTANDIQLFVEFLSDDIRAIFLSIIAGILLTVTHGSDSLAAYRDTVNGSSGQVISAGTSLNGYRRNGTGIQNDRAVGTVNSYGRAVCSFSRDRTVSTVDSYGRTVSTVQRNRAIGTGCTGFAVGCTAQGNVISQFHIISR